MNDIVNGNLTNEEVVEGLKTALDVGLDTSVSSASSVDGYLKNEVIKILLPEEVKELQNKINNESVAGIPLKIIYDVYVAANNNGNDLFDELVTAMNKGAENAADKALPIFGDALTNMSIQDGFDILNGGDRAATEYFETETRTGLITAFSPDVTEALDGTGAIELYSGIASIINYEYTAVGGLVTVSPGQVLNIQLPSSIEEYATGKAVDGLFHLVGEEEKKIRDDPFAWGSRIIERVFGSLLD